MDADGSNVTRLTHDAAHACCPAWAPEGGAIAFASDRDGNLEIYMMHPDGTGLTRLTDNPATDTSPRWHP
jgi:Tol biopolymer transport system component